MNDEEAAKLRKRAILSATRKGLAEQSEDLAHDSIVRWLEGKGQHQTVEQSIIDSFRGTRRKRDAASPQYRRVEARDDDTMDDLENIPGAPIDRDTDSDFERIIQPLEQNDRIVMVLLYVWGLKLNEIGHCFGISESRVSQRIRGIQERISQTVAGQEQRSPGEIRQNIQGNELWQGSAEAYLETPCSKERQEMERGTYFGLETEESGSLEENSQENFPEWFS